MTDKTALGLYRSVRKEDFPDGVIVDGKAVTEILCPSFEPKTYEVKKRGKVETRARPADVVPVVEEGEQIVYPESGGTSLFDKKLDKVFLEKFWLFFTIPEGTEIPGSLRIRHTGRNTAYQAEHYQIEAASGRMTVGQFKGAVDNLARNAVVKAYEDAHGGG
jgi:hypothetical protein